MYIVQFDAIAAVLTLINLYIFYNQKRVKDGLSSRFELMLWVTLGSSLFSAVSSWAINRPDLFGLTSRIGTTMLFYVFHNTLPFTIALYVLTLTRKKLKGSREVALFCLPFVAAILLILTNPLTHFVFYYDDALRYRRGGGLLALYCLAGSYYIYLVYVLITRKKELRPLTRFVFPIVLTVPLIAIGIENIISSQRVLLECFASAVSMLLVSYTIQNSSELLDGTTGLFNKTAFIKHASTLLQNRIAFDVLILSIRDMPLMRQVFDIQGLLRLSQSISLFLTRQTKKLGTVFALENDCYAVALYGSIAASEKRTLLDDVIKRFYQTWPVGETEVEIAMRACLLRCPDDAKGVIEIFDCLDRMTSMDPSEDRSGIVRPEDLNLADSSREAEAERALRHTVETGRIELLLQPVYSIFQSKIVFAEAMLTLRTEDGKRIPQNELLRVAERVGFAQRLGLMIIDSVCALYAARAMEDVWIDQILVRLSGAQCMQSDLAEQALAVIDAWRFDPRHLCFEVTETAAVNSPAILDRNMKMLSERDLLFALDDYGSGYTDLGYIVELPFNLIKLDKSIVHAGFQSEKGRIIMASTIELIKRLKRRIVADGVETTEQAEALATLGCDYLQGFYIGEPVLAKDFKADRVL